VIRRAAITGGGYTTAMPVLLDRATRLALHALLYFPSRQIACTPAEAGCEFEKVSLATEDGERLGGWWIDGRSPVIGHLLFCHGNGGNIGDRVRTAASLAAAGFDVLLFDYRGYGASTGSADELGTYGDARAARAALVGRADVDPSRIFYLGESLGGAVALKLAIEAPPRGLILQSTFTSIRDVARHHYPFIPSPLVPDVYPSLRRIGSLRAPLLVLHGDRDDTVPLALGQALLEAAPEPKRMRVFRGLEHDVSMAGAEYASAIADFASAVEDG
jgi:pimeloyl-ACP methyl ester carboxylesterase